MQKDILLNANNYMIKHQRKQFKKRVYMCLYQRVVKFCLKLCIELLFISFRDSRMAWHGIHSVHEESDLSPSDVFTFLLSYSGSFVAGDIPIFECCHLPHLLVGSHSVVVCFRYHFVSLRYPIHIQVYCISLFPLQIISMKSQPPNSLLS